MNKEKLKGIWEKIKTTLKKVSKKMWILIAAVAIIVAVVIVVILNNRPYSILITEATPDEVSTVSTWLGEQGVTNYRTEGNGTILVPEAQAANLKARLLQEQYASKGTSFSGYFEKTGALSTQLDRNNAWQVALMDEMASTIRQFEGVQDAAVTLDMGQDRTYVLDSNNLTKATAGVVLTMKNGQTLSDQQANAIRNYIAHSVAGLDIEDASISDTNGQEYTGGGISSSEGSSALKLRLEQEYSNAVRKRVLDSLRKAYGTDNVEVGVSVVIDLSDTTTEEYEPILPEYARDGSTNGAGIIGRRVYSYNTGEGDGALAGGTVGTGVNSDIPTYVEEGADDQNLGDRLNGSGEINYDNPKRQTTSRTTAGYISDCTVAVTINSETAGYVNTESVRRHVATAAGITPVATETMTEDQYLSTKVSVMSFPFWTEEAPPSPAESFMDRIGLPVWALYAFVGGIILFVVLLVVILLLRRKKREKEEAELQAVEEFIAAAMPEEGEPQGADVMELHTERSMELRQSIRDFVDENAEVAALLLRGWLKGDEENA